MLAPNNPEYQTGSLIIIMPTDDMQLIQMIYPYITKDFTKNYFTQDIQMYWYIIINQ